MMTKYKDSNIQAVQLVTDLFKLLPMSFKTRNEEPLNDLTYKFYTYEKLIVIKMTENRLQDNDSFKKTSRKFEILHAESDAYY